MELDTAAQILLAPPNAITPEQRQSAERVFLEFRETKTPYIMCRQILETSSVDYVLFESAGLIKIALMREWSLLSKDDIISLEDYLLHYAVNRPTLAPFVRERILQVIAIMAKRWTVEDSGENVTMLLNRIEFMIMSGDLEKKLLGCGIVSALLQEFEAIEKSSDIEISWENHIISKKKFTETHLMRIVNLFFTALSQFTSDVVPGEALPLIRYLLSITEEIFTWSPLIRSESNFYIFNRDMKAETEWREYILDPQFIQFFFTLYSKVRTNLSLAYLSRNCLIALAKLDGQEISHDLQVNYVNNYMSELLKLVSNIDIMDQEALGIVNIIDGIFTSFRSILNSLEPQIFNSFLKQMVQLTRIFAKGAAQEESSCSDDYLYADAFHHMLETWSLALFNIRLDLNSGDNKTRFRRRKNIDLEMKQLKENNLKIDPQLQSELYVHIFDIYLKCKLSPPDGFRVISNRELDTEIIDIEEDDRTKYKDQLVIIGRVGRKILSHSLKLLSHLIEKQTSLLRQELDALLISANLKNLQLTQSNSIACTSSGLENLLKTYEEDLHWLILLAGHVLCIESDDNLIPNDIHYYGISQLSEGKVNTEVTLSLLVSLHCNLPDVSDTEKSVDHVIQLIASIFHLYGVKRNAIEADMVHILSPELIGTIIWFLHRISKSYLMPTYGSYPSSCSAIAQTFGAYTIEAQWSVNFLLDNSRYILNAFKGEETIVNGILQLLLALVETTEKASCVLKSEKFSHFTELITKNEFSFPESTKRGLMGIIVRVGRGLDDEDEKQYVLQTMEPLQKQFIQILSSNDFSRTNHDVQTRLQIVELLNYLIGIVEGMMKYNGGMMSSVFPFLHPMLNELPNLLSVYSNYQDVVLLILELLCDCSQIINYDCHKEETIQMYEIYLHTCTVYGRCNVNKLTTAVDDEENPFPDTFLFMQILINVSKSSIFYSKDDFVNQQPFSCADVLTSGLNVLVPMMTSELIKYPILYETYYKIIINFVEISKEKVYALPSELLKQLMMSVELGCYMFQGDISKLCLDIILPLAIHNLETAIGEPNTLLVPFVKLLINLCISTERHMDVGVRAIFYLIRCYPDEYRKFMESYIASQSNTEIQQQLTSVINEFNTNINIKNWNTTDICKRGRFILNFQLFVRTVQGFLIIK